MKLTSFVFSAAIICGVLFISKSYAQQNGQYDGTTKRLTTDPAPVLPKVEGNKGTGELKNPEAKDPCVYIGDNTQKKYNQAQENFRIQHDQRKAREAAEKNKISTKDWMKN